MNKSNPDRRAAWVGCLLLAAAIAAGCAEQTRVSEPPEVDESTDALSREQFECEREKRECLVTADCDADARDACESAFHSCADPVQAEKKRVHDDCRAERQACEDGAADEAARRACSLEERRCKLPVDPPEAVCHIDALECVSGAADSTAEKACRDDERACRDAMRLDPKELPKRPDCSPGPNPPPPPPACPPVAPEPPAPPAADPPPPASGSPAGFECEREKRECLVAADCEEDAREACESAFRECAEGVRAEKKRVHDLCRATHKTCEEAATDEAGRRACRVAEQECKLPVEPPEAVCRIEAEECVRAARGAEPPPPDRMMPPDRMVPPDPMMPPDPMTPPDPMKAPKPMTPPEENSAVKACRETERECRESTRMSRDDLPKPPHCGPRPPQCSPPSP